MSIQKSSNNQKQKDLENLCWNFKQYILKNKLIRDLPTMVINQIHTLSHNLENCSFTNDNYKQLEGKIPCEEDIKQLILNITKIDNWEVTKEEINTQQIKSFKEEFAISFEEKDIFEYTFSRDIYTNRDIKCIVLVVFPQYYYVKFQIISDEIGVSELLEESELVNLLQKEFN